MPLEGQLAIDANVRGCPGQLWKIAQRQHLSSRFEVVHQGADFPRDRSGLTGLGSESHVDHLDGGEKLF